MTRNKTYRPRTTRERRDEVLQAAEQLNGAEVSGLHEALGLFCRYLDVLYGNVSCPECDEPLEEITAGQYYCWWCEENDRDAYPDAWDVLDSDDPDSASFPGLSRSIRMRFECDHESQDSGTDERESTQHGQSHGENTHDRHQDRRSDRY